ncbi:type I-E CRISPR-associated protein Cse1/CasA [Arsenicicoccus cauae]|uniref:type I-E CRISPR-associated protein Cse1/CasA n=1 Tax=Arsenicicoccus cauae TaxID=2663847 RepID=UPI00370D9BDA
MSEDSFNLLDKPWIRVRTTDGDLEEVSLLEVLDRAPQLDALAGEMPTQDAAVLRILLAVLHRVVPGGEDSEAAVDAWDDVWRAGALPMDDVRAYLDKYRDRFDLLDPVASFGQVAGLQTAKEGWSGLAKLVGEHPYGVPHFTVRGGAGLRSLSLGEAARWLVHCQAFDPSGIKPGAIGDPRVMGGKGYPIGTGWAGSLGLFVLEGRSLFETLMLNLVVRASHRDDRPVWERPALGAAEEAGPRQPQGPADIMTWPSRRIRLKVDDGAVVDALICNGDRIELQDRQRVETMSVWRDSEAQAKKFGRQVTVPRAHLPARAVWRGLPATLEAGSAGSQVASMQTQEWVSLLTKEEVLGYDFPLRLHAIGMSYGAKNSSVVDLIDDLLTLRPAVLADPGLRQRAIDAVHSADRAASALGWFAELLFQAAGGDGKNEAEVHRTAARETAYTLLDLPCRRALRALGPSTEPGSWHTAWEQTVRQLIGDEALRMVRAAGRPALVGRPVRVSESRADHIDAASALSRLHHTLRKALPLAYPSTAERPEGETS